MPAWVAAAISWAAPAVATAATLAPAAGSRTSTSSPERDELGDESASPASDAAPPDLAPPAERPPPPEESTTSDPLPLPDLERAEAAPPSDPPAPAQAEVGDATSRPPRPPPATTSEYGRDVVVPRQRPRPVHERRASSLVTREELQERLPRSAPDALIYEPGVYVQRTAHAQASPYVRGLTGQQTFLAFDGIRLNNATFRSGPNQYFFTVDSRTIQSLEVVRGSASTRWGSDAIGGALLSTPVDPTLDGHKRWEVHPRVMGATRTADTELGGRAQLDLVYRGKVGIIGGVGYRDVGLLETAGPIRAPATGETHKSPRFAEDGRTQLGTGFREFTADARAVYRPNDDFKLTLAHYDYRQMDAPRTDKCPPAQAPEDQCLVYLQQFRGLTYAALETHAGPAAIRDARVTLSYQKQHERRQMFADNGVPDVPGGTEQNGLDDVHTAGSSLQLSTRTWRPGDEAEYRLDYGGDVYYDQVRSHAWLVFTDLDPEVVRVASRGQYLDGGQYVTSGVWAENDLRLWDRVGLRGGGRVAHASANATGDEASDSAGVSESWVTAVGDAGVSVDTAEWLTLLFGYDQGFRAPNLDDLTSRQQTGPGFQYENASLAPEHAHTLETGFKVRHERVEASAFVHETKIRGLIARAPRTTDDCPNDDASGCASSAALFQLVNLDGEAVIRGFDAAFRLFLPAGFTLNATIAYAIGDGPNPIPPPSDPELVSSYRSRQPLSRVPPLNGTAELGWRAPLGLWLGASLRWATLQDRLAPADVADIRIPAGGTPGFAVVDLRAGFRHDPALVVGLVFENVGDVAYRYHGSSVNGAARSLSMQVELGF